MEWLLEVMSWTKNRFNAFNLSKRTTDKIKALHSAPWSDTSCDDASSLERQYAVSTRVYKSWFPVNKISINLNTSVIQNHG